MQQNSERHRFLKAEKITSEKQIELLFKKGKRKQFSSLSLTWIIHSSDEVLFPQILISAPKKRFRKAIQRNRVKRQIREAYRLQKVELVRLAAEKQKWVQMAVVYTGKEAQGYHQIEKDMKELLGWMVQKIKG